VTIANAVTGQLAWGLVPGYIIAQFLGAFVGAVIVWLAYLPHWPETEDEGLKLGVFSTAPAIYNTPANLITEIIGTFVLVFGIFGIVANAGAVSGGAAVVIASGLNPLIIGLLVVGIGLATPSTPPATWGRVSPTPCCPSRAMAATTGGTPGSLSWGLSSAASSALCCLPSCSDRGES
jgi:glycerol uptake facilitator-like aquaporin